MTSGHKDDLAHEIAGQGTKRQLPEEPTKDERLPVEEAKTNPKSNEELSDLACALIIGAIVKTPDINNPTLLRTKADREEIDEFDDFEMPKRETKKKKKKLAKKE